jgi:hypothetical protein
MAEFTQYRRKQIAELADWHPGFDMTGVSVSIADRAAGSPKPGDKIARNPANHADRWLVAAEYFDANFAPLSHGNDLPPRTPLTDEQINDEMDRLLLSPVEQEAFGAGVRYAERAHGIGEKQ